MPKFSADGVEIYYEVTGEGFPLVWSHEFGGFRGFVMNRPTIYALEDKLRALQVPTLIMIGDEDEPCIEPAVFMKRNIPMSGLSVFPQSGHAINLEEPDLFNRTVSDFLTAVEAGRWAERQH